MCKIQFESLDKAKEGLKSSFFGILVMLFIMIIDHFTRPMILKFALLLGMGGIYSSKIMFFFNDIIPKFILIILIILSIQPLIYIICNSQNKLE